MIPQLFKHQSRALEAAGRFNSRLIFRLPGTGKTRIGIEIIMDQLRREGNSRILWVCPANLIAQLKEVFSEFGVDLYDLFPDRNFHAGRCAICSYDMLRLNCRFVCTAPWDLVICDEIHRGKSNVAQTNHALWQLRKRAARWYGFTGTPFQNSPYEFFELVSLCVGSHIGAACEFCLQYKYPKHTPIRNFLRQLGMRLHRVNQGPVVGIRDKDKLRLYLSDVVDYIPPDRYLDECRLPNILTSTVRIPLTPREETEYLSVLSRFNRKKKYKFFFTDDIGDEYLENCFNGLNTLRTVALRESKPEAVADILRGIKQEDSSARILIFCNFVERGLNVLSGELKKRDIEHILYDGKVSATKRSEYIADFHQGKRNVMLLSPVGFEGLDLYGTTHIIVVDPHYNPERTKQLTSRAIRAFSNVREIKIIKLQSISRKIKKPLIDEIIENIAARKSKVAGFLEDVLR